MENGLVHDLATAAELASRTASRLKFQKARIPATWLGKYVAIQWTINVAAPEGLVLLVKKAAEADGLWAQKAREYL